MFNKVHVFRIKPEKELLHEVLKYCSDNGITSGVIIGIIGSLSKATLNYLVDLPGKFNSIKYTGLLEIVCAQGSVALSDRGPIVHIHLQISNENVCHGGHLASANVFTTAEVTLGELDYQLFRKLDSYTGLFELQ
jgi:predicted DNA-binding protein with PD1-like motif